jgi:hypothetical protein
MHTYTHESKNAAQDFDACLQQARDAAIRQGRPFTLQAGTVDGVFTLSLTVGPKAEAPAEPEPPKTMKPVNLRLRKPGVPKELADAAGETT